ncbi:MAG: hypothetical protein ACRED8_08640 [Caulobacteraceae bacterium]
MRILAWVGGVIGVLVIAAIIVAFVSGDFWPAKRSPRTPVNGRSANSGVLNNPAAMRASPLAGDRRKD